MPKILMNVLKPHRYAGKMQRPGGQYQADGEGHARLMEALGHAARAPAEAAPASPSPAPAVHGTYLRRDQVAEDLPSTYAPRKRAAAKKAVAKMLARRRDDAPAEEPEGGPAE